MKLWGKYILTEFFRRKATEGFMGGIKVSIIVPVFNMERLLKKCVDSILCQSYANLQIIIVDDGSEDKSGEMADKYAMQDSRISVVHHLANKGIACGFQSGLETADGDFVLFVDSDNTISPLMIERLVEYQERYYADVVQCEAVCYKNEDEIHLYTERNSFLRGVKKILEKQDIIQDFLYSKTITNNLAAKLIRRCLFSGIEIPEGRQIVDVIILPQILDNSIKYVCVKDPLYYAYQPDDSVSRGPISNWRLDDLIFENQFYERFMDEHWKKYRNYIPYRKICTSLWAYDRLLLSNHVERADGYLDYFYKIIKDNYRETRKGEYYGNMTIKEKMKLFVLLFSRNIYNGIIIKRHLQIG